MKPEILFENDQFIAVNKPSGLLSIPARKQTVPSLKDILLQKYGSIYTVHRLDKNTSGLILFAKTEEAHKKLSELFMTRAMEKYYLGIVNGVFYPAKGTVDVLMTEHPAKNGTMIVSSKGKESVTDYETLETFPLYSLVQFQIHTGRTHQIRVHAKYLGHSIVCDDLYGDNKGIYVSALKKDYWLSLKEENEKPILGRLALHSFRLSFVLDGTPYSLEAPLFKDMRATLQQLRKHAK